MPAPKEPIRVTPGGLLAVVWAAIAARQAELSPVQQTPTRFPRDHARELRAACDDALAAGLQAVEIPRVPDAMIDKPYLLESSLRDDVTKYLTCVPFCYAIKLHGSPYMPRGVPDFVVSFLGLSVWIELKVAGEEPSPAQRLQHKAIGRALGAVAVCRSVADVRDLLITVASCDRRPQ